jgi:hypothetical protein
MEISYLAGLFDGEGSISIIHQLSRPRRNRHYHVLQVNITNTHEGVLRTVRDAVGFGLFRAKSVRGKHSNCKTVFEWNARSDQARRFLELVLPFLIIKKARADLALEFQGRISRCSTAINCEQHWKSDYCDAMRKLNHTFGSAKMLTFCQFRPASLPGLFTP